MRECALNSGNVYPGGLPGNSVARIIDCPYQTKKSFMIAVNNTQQDNVGSIIANKFFFGWPYMMCLELSSLQHNKTS